MGRDLDRSTIGDDVLDGPIHIVYGDETQPHRSGRARASLRELKHPAHQMVASGFPVSYLPEVVFLVRLTGTHDLPTEDLGIERDGRLAIGCHQFIPNEITLFDGHICLL